MQSCSGDTFLAFTGHMMLLSVGAGSPWRDVAGATRGSSTSRNASEAQPVILKFWIRPSSVKSQTVTSQNSLMHGYTHVSGTDPFSNIAPHWRHNQNIEYRSRPIVADLRFTESENHQVVEVQSPSTCNIKKKSVQPNVQEIPASTGQLVTPSCHQTLKSTEGCDASGEMSAVFF